MNNLYRCKRKKVSYTQLLAKEWNNRLNFPTTKYKLLRLSSTGQGNNW